MIFKKNRIDKLPIVVLMPYGGCNCRCVMCGYWEGDRERLTVEDLQGQMEAFKALGVQWFLFSGGEALMHPDLFSIADVLQPLGAKSSLLTNGLMLKKAAGEIMDHFDEVIVSLDGEKEVHEGIRGVEGSFDKLVEGVKALKAMNPSYPVSGRSVIQKANHASLPGIIDAARSMGLDRISFLPVDATTKAFSRVQLSSSLAPDAMETETLRRILKETFKRYKKEFATGFVAERPRKLGKMVTYFEAVNGKGVFEAPACNAPWVSAVVEADGTVRPCFFQMPLGNIREGRLDEILNSEASLAFRKRLDIKEDSICRQCVCPLYLRPGSLK
jgi:MoaA/NifB/PqqE/SkfB family radical SAM enzyme